MKHSLLLLFILINTVCAISQELPTGEKVINVYIDSVGGRENLLEVHSTIMEFEGKVFDMEFSTKSYRIYPDKLKIILTEPHKETIRIYNEGKGIVLVNGSGSQMDDLTRNGMQEEAQIFPFLYHIENGCRVTNLGEKDYEKGHYELELLFPDGRKRYDYYSINTGLLMKSIDVATAGTTYFSEYKYFGKVKIPTKARLRTKEAVLEFTLASYEINPKIKKKEFEIMPMPNN
jgi:outer membrane lipoprotein-sorting protein